MINAFTLSLHTHTKNWDNNTFWIFRAFNSFWFTDIYGRLEIFRYLHILVLKSTFVERTLKMPKLSHQSKIQTWNCKKKNALISCLKAVQPAKPPYLIANIYGPQQVKGGTLWKIKVWRKVHFSNDGQNEDLTNQLNLTVQWCAFYSWLKWSLFQDSKETIPSAEICNTMCESQSDFYWDEAKK